MHPHFVIVMGTWGTQQKHHLNPWELGGNKLRTWWVYNRHSYVLKKDLNCLHMYIQLTTHGLFSKDFLYRQNIGCLNDYLQKHKGSFCNKVFFARAF